MSYIHDPNAVLRYGQDWTDWLATGETISTATAVCADPGITISGVQVASPLVTFQAAGGTNLVDYDVVVHVTSSLGEQDDRTTRLKCRQR